MQNYTLSGATLHDAAKLGILPAHPKQKRVMHTPGTPKARFPAKKGIGVSALLKTLQNEEHLTRRMLADIMQCSKQTVARELAPLVKKGLVNQVWEDRGNGYAYHYSIIQTRDINSIWRTRCFVWQHCPSCGAKRRLRRQPTGEYLRWCRCGAKSELISQERIKT